MKHKKYTQFVEDLTPFKSYDDVVQNSGAIATAYKRKDGKYGDWGNGPNATGFDWVSVWFTTPEQSERIAIKARSLGYTVQTEVDSEFMKAPHLTTGRLGRKEPYYRVDIKKKT